MSVLFLLALQAAVADPVPLTPEAPAAIAPVFVFFLPPPPAPMLLLTPTRPGDAPPDLPESVRAVLAAAVASNDPAAVAAVVRFAKTTNPETAGQVELINQAFQARLAAKKAREAREKRDKLLAGGPLDFWSGSVEFGASLSTGNTQQSGVYGSVSATRDGVYWRHKLSARIDFQRTDGTTTTERAIATYQPNYKLGDRLYTYGLAQYERDRLLGYTLRLTEGTGLGYSVASGDKLKLDVEAGPALRQTNYVDDPSENALAARGSVALTWKLTPTLNFTQNAAFYLQHGGNNASSSTALDTKLIGKLKAKLSFNVNYEGDPTDGQKSVDTVSRATLVYGF